MNKPLSEILNSIPPKPPRSKLEPHFQLIRELRRRKTTYREIAKVLEEFIGLHVDPSTIYDFVQVRKRRARPARHVEELPSTPCADGIAPPNSEVESPISSRTSTMDGTSDAYSRIEALKRRRHNPETKDQAFHFEEGGPLHIVSDPRKK